MRVQRKLHVAAAFDFQLTDDFERAVAQHLHFLVGERLRGRNDYAVTGMHADGVEVFHTAYRNRGIVRVAHDFELDFLEPFDALFDQHLPHGRELERVFHNLAQLLFRLRKTAARAAERERGAQHHGIAYIQRSFFRFLYAVSYLRRDDGLADAHTHLFEFFAVFRHFDTFKRRSEQFNIAFVQNPAVRELHRKIEPRLSAEGGDDCVGTLVTDDARDVFEGERLHIYLVRHHLVRHNRGGVGVGKDDFVALFFQRDARLRARIVEFRRLSYDNGPGAYDQNFLYIRSLRHFSSTPRCWQ